MNSINNKPVKQTGYLLPPLIRGRLIKRYKRFLADVELDTGETITAHCPNSGSMKECAIPGSRVWLSFSDNPKRKYPHTWELIKVADTCIGINTLVQNGVKIITRDTRISTRVIQVDKAVPVDLS